MDDIFLFNISDDNIKIIYEKYSEKILFYIKQNNIEKDTIDHLKMNMYVENSYIKRFIQFSCEYDSDFTKNDILIIFFILLKYKHIWHLTNLFSYLIDELYKNNIDILKYEDNILKIKYPLNPSIIKTLKH